MRRFWKIYYKGIHEWFRTILVRCGYHSKPTFAVIGAQKGGTTALHRYLAEHPSIMSPTKKEIHFFDLDESFEKGEVWYHNYFPLPHTLGKHAITYDNTPSYLYYPKSAKRIFSYYPNMKLIVSLRDPVERAFSAWTMFHNFHKDTNHPYYHLAEFREFDKAVRDEIDKMLSGDPTLEPSYVRRGIYYEQLLRYFKYFKREQIFIIDSYSLKKNTSLILTEVIQFLGLPKFDCHQLKLPLLNIGNYEKQMPAETQAFLREFYKPYNEKLYELLGYDFDWQ